MAKIPRDSNAFNSILSCLRKLTRVEHDTYLRSEPLQRFVNKTADEISKDIYTLMDEVSNNLDFTHTEIRRIFNYYHREMEKIADAFNEKNLCETNPEKLQTELVKSVTALHSKAESLKADLQTQQSEFQKYIHDFMLNIQQKSAYGCSILNTLKIEQPSNKFIVNQQDSLHNKIDPHFNEYLHLASKTMSDNHALHPVNTTSMMPEQYQQNLIGNSSQKNAKSNTVMDLPIQQYTSDQILPTENINQNLNSNRTTGSNNSTIPNFELPQPFYITNKPPTLIQNIKPQVNFESNIIKPQKTEEKISATTLTTMETMKKKLQNTSIKSVLNENNIENIPIKAEIMQQKPCVINTQNHVLNAAPIVIPAKPTDTVPINNKKEEPSKQNIQAASNQKLINSDDLLSQTQSLSQDPMENKITSQTQSLPQDPMENKITSQTQSLNSNHPNPQAMNIQPSASKANISPNVDTNKNDQNVADSNIQNSITSHTQSLDMSQSGNQEMFQKQLVNKQITNTNPQQSEQVTQDELQSTTQSDDQNMRTTLLEQHPGSKAKIMRYMDYLENNRNASSTMPQNVMSYTEYLEQVEKFEEQQQQSEMIEKDKILNDLSGPKAVKKFTTSITSQIGKASSDTIQKLNSDLMKNIGFSPDQFNQFNPNVKPKPLPSKITSSSNAIQNNVSNAASMSSPQQTVSSTSNAMKNKPSDPAQRNQPKKPSAQGTKPKTTPKQNVANTRNIIPNRVSNITATQNIQPKKTPSQNVKNNQNLMQFRVSNVTAAQPIQSKKTSQPKVRNTPNVMQPKVSNTTTTQNIQPRSVPQQNKVNHTQRMTTRKPNTTGVSNQQKSQSVHVEQPGFTQQPQNKPNTYYKVPPSGRRRSR